MSVDLILHAGEKWVIDQWMQARGLMVRDETVTVDPETGVETTTYGDWELAPGVTFHYWNHPSGKIPATIDNTDPEAPVTTMLAGFYARMSLEEVPAGLKSWTETSTATSVLQSMAGVGGEGITILNPEDVYAHCASIGAPVWGGLLGVGNQWSDPALWAFSNVMTGDTREYDGVTFQSLIDFNVWTPTQYPQGWQEVVAEPPSGPEPWVQPTGGHDAYPLGAQVTHNGQTWVNTGSDANVWEPGVFGWEVI